MFRILRTTVVRSPAYRPRASHDQFDVWLPLTDNDFLNTEGLFICLYYYYYYYYYCDPSTTVGMERWMD